MLKEKQTDVTSWKALPYLWPPFCKKKSRMKLSMSEQREFNVNSHVIFHLFWATSQTTVFFGNHVNPIKFRLLHSSTTIVLWHSCW